MIFTETKLKGVFLITLEPNIDERGSFARTFCLDEFRKHGINMQVIQANISKNMKKGTLRGMHYQESPFAEDKLVSCIKGAIFDVIIDLRKDSDTYMQWLSVELSEGDNKILYVPKGFAHGFITLVDLTHVSYLVSEYYNKDAERGIRYNDPRFAINWPIEITNISQRDMSHKDFS